MRHVIPDVVEGHRHRRTRLLLRSCTPKRIRRREALTGAETGKRLGSRNHSIEQEIQMLRDVLALRGSSPVLDIHDRDVVEERR